MTEENFQIFACLFTFTLAVSQVITMCNVYHVHASDWTPP